MIARARCEAKRSDGRSAIGARAVLPVLFKLP